MAAKAQTCITIILDKRFTALFLVFLFILLLMPPALSHHQSFRQLAKDKDLLASPAIVNHFKEIGGFRIAFSYYPVGDAGLYDFSVRVENIGSGFYYNKGLTFQLIDPQGDKLPTYSPFLDNEYNYKMRQFLENKGQYILVIRLTQEYGQEEIEFPFQIKEKTSGELCAWCGMSITNSKTLYYLTLDTGEIKNTCCAHCAIYAKMKFNDKLILMESLDYYSGTKLKAQKAWFVKDPDIQLEDSMPPYILSFDSLQSAQGFQRKHQGEIMDYEGLEQEIGKNHDPNFSSDEIAELTLLEGLIYNIKENYYKDIDVKKMVSLSIEAILASLDKNSSLIQNQPSSLDFLRGFDRDETISEPRIMDGDIGYIKIHYFGRRTKEDFAKAMINIREYIKGLIIDLRDNPGGSLEEAVAIMEYFVPEGYMLASFNAGSRQKTYVSNNNEDWDIPLVILINHNTASSAEIFASTLHYYKKAILVGKNTYGKATIQKAFPMDNEHTLILTIGQCYFADGKPLGDAGIVPDHEIEGDERQLETALILLKAGKRGVLDESDE